MALGSYEVQPLFAEPYFRTNIAHAISDAQVAFIRELSMVQNQANLISENLYIFDEPALASVKEAVSEALAVYAKEVMGIDQELYVTQSWALTNPPGVGMHGHSHSNSLVSGSLYYCDLPSPVASMIFDKHNTYQQLDLHPGKAKRNIYNTPMNMVTPKRADLILFSSALQHFVETNSAGEPRHSIAFNSFVRGKLGNYRDVSELTL
ncbi:MAG: putative 2OG-Fe(II) oxygenase [Pseudomonadota bacterium]